MARRKTLYQVQQQFEALKRKQDYLKANPKPRKTTVDRKPETGVIYSSYLQVETSGEGNAATTISERYEIQASKSAVAFFGGRDDLGLGDPSTSAVQLLPPPAYFTPAKIHAKVGSDNATATTTPWGTRVVKTYRNTSGENQGFYSAPISSGDTSATFLKIQAKAKAIAAAFKTANKLGSGNAAFYGKLWVTPEVFNIDFEAVNLPTEPA